MVKKQPRRTAQRILETSLHLFNRFGEPNVSTTLISAELRISPGNLYYHYAAKDVIINTLFDDFESALQTLLAASSSVRNVEDAWFFLHTLFELIWQYRFLYRDLNDLLSNNRRLEIHFKNILEHKTKAIQCLLTSMENAGSIQISTTDVEATATSMVVLITYWLSFEYVRDPRRALEEAATELSLLRGAHHSLHLLMPYFETAQRHHLQALILAYRTEKSDITSAGDGSRSNHFTA